MRMRDRKMAVDRQSLFNIHLAEFVADLNRTVEEAYRSLDEVLDMVEDDAGDEGQPDGGQEDRVGQPPG
jgi:hypothetical protein